MAGLEPRIKSTLFQSVDEEGVYTTANIADTYECTRSTTMVDVDIF